MSAIETEDMADTNLQNESAPQSAMDLDNNSEISTSSQSAEAVSPSGARSLANLLMMEHDFCRMRYAREIGNILASRLDGFTHCDGVIVWVKKNKTNNIIMSRFDGSQLKTIKDKNLEKWKKNLLSGGIGQIRLQGNLLRRQYLQRFLTFGQIYFRLKGFMPT